MTVHQNERDMIEEDLLLLLDITIGMLLQDTANLRPLAATLTCTESFLQWIDLFKEEGLLNQIGTETLDIPTGKIMQDHSWIILEDHWTTIQWIEDLQLNRMELFVVIHQHAMEEIMREGDPLHLMDMETEIIEHHHQCNLIIPDLL